MYCCHAANQVTRLAHIGARRGEGYGDQHTATILVISAVRSQVPRRDIGLKCRERHWIGAAYPPLTSDRIAQTDEFAGKSVDLSITAVCMEPRTITAAQRR